MNVKINPSEVQKTGEQHYPDLAQSLKTIAKIGNDEQRKKLPTALAGTQMQQPWAQYAAQVFMAIEVSGIHLERCGELLAKVAKDHAWTDQETADAIRKPFTGEIDDAMDTIDNDK